MKSACWNLGWGGGIAFLLSAAHLSAQTAVPPAVPAASAPVPVDPFDDDHFIAPPTRYIPPQPTGTHVTFRPYPASPGLTNNLARFRLQAYICRSDSQETSFVLFTPRVSAPATQKVPVVLFLHGIGETGPDLNQLFRQPGIFKTITTPEFQARFPCYLVAPQHLPKENLPWNSQRLGAAGEILLWLCRRGTPRADPDRLYVTGLSSGGLGAYDATVRFPGLYAAAVPVAVSTYWRPEFLDHANICRYWQISNRSNVASTNTQAAHRRFEQRVRELGGELRLSIYDRKDHDAWNWAYTEPALWDWVFTRSRRGVLPPPPTPPASAHRAVAGPAPAAATAAAALPPCTAHSSCAAAANQPPAMAVDGLLKSQFVSRGPARAGDYLHVAFDKPQLNLKLKILTGHENGAGRLQEGLVQGSTDGQRFKTLATLRDGSAVVATRNQLLRALRIVVKADQPEPLVIREILLEP